jgi:UDP-N-acetylglucosamine acyltransferase
MSIHPTAIIGTEVELAPDVVVGPYSILTGRVRVGRGTRIESHASIGNIKGDVEIGEGNHILPGAMVGGPPQDLSYKGEVTKLSIGDRNIIREFTTINCGTLKDGGITRIGNDCMLMAYVHVAHDCQLGNGVIVANSVQFAGHVSVGDHARIGGMVGLAQFTRVGEFAYIGGGSTINKDIIPYSIAEGNWAKVRAANKVGMTRAGFAKEEVENIYRAIRFLIMGERTIEEALAKIHEECEPTDHIKYLVDFVRTSEGGVAR